MIVMGRGLRVFCLLVTILLGAARPALAADVTLEQLAAEGRLELEASISPSDNVVPGQKMTLTLEIATDRWFSGGTRLSLPEVAGLVILQTEQFASNASERRGDRDWVLQRWTLDIFPQRTGDFKVPPVTARMKINAGDAGDIEGAIKSPSTSFSVSVPPALADIEQWVAAPAYRVSQSFDRSLEGLQVGDAFEREILFEADEVMAMMLPSFTAEDLPGLAAYPAPPVLDNSNNRGQSSASRRQRISYVVQAEGQYQLPAVDYFWWDTQGQALQVLSLPATVITVGSGVASAPGDRGDEWTFSPRQWLLLGLGLALFAVLLWLASKVWQRIPLARLHDALAAPVRKVVELRKPALPEKLNPGSSAGE